MINTDTQPLKPKHFAQKGRWQKALMQIFTADLFWILIISAIIRGIYYSVLLTTRAVDTASYLNYNANILKGETEALRTPVYPYFIKLIGLFGQQNLFNNVVAVQIVISFLTIVLFYKIVSTFFKTRVIIIAATLLYGVMLPIINFDKMLITESLSVSFGVMFIYFMVSYLQQPKHIKACGLTLFIISAIMLRPSFIYLLPLIIAFWILRLALVKQERRVCRSGLAASLIAVLLLMGYAGLNKKHFGFNGISVVSNNNQMAVIVDGNLYRNGNDPEITAAIIHNSNLPKGIAQVKYGINIMKRFPPERVHAFLLNCIRNQPAAYAGYIAHKFAQLQADNIFTNYAEHKVNTLAFKIEHIEYAVFRIRFGMLYGFIVLDLILIIAIWIKRRQIPWFKIMLWCIITAQLLVAVLGGYSEYQRLILAAMPALVIAVFYYIDVLCSLKIADRKHFPS